MELTSDGARGQLAHRADHFGVAGMADQDDLPSALEMNLRLAMDLGDERAGRVDGEQIARQRLFRHAFGDAMGGEDHRRRPGGASLSSSMNTTPLAFSESTTYLLCTISCRT